MTDKATHTPLPCPFCSAQIEIAKWEGNYGFAHPRQSERCIMEGDFYDYATEAEALTAWNTRAVNSHHDLIEALRAVEAAMMRGGDGRILDTGWNITKLNEARPLIRAILTKEAGHG